MYNPEMMVRRYKTPALEGALEPLIERAAEQFPVVPRLRLLCFFDADQERLPEAISGREGYIRGFHCPIVGSGWWPEYIEDLFYDCEGYDLFDNIIYLRGEVCKEPVGAVITFAHELQHFVQYGTGYLLWAANTLLFNNLVDFEPGTSAQSWDIPIEREARIVSKRVAEGVCGAEAVRSHIDRQIAESRVGSERHHWEFMRSLDTSRSYDLLAETVPLVDRHKSRLRTLEDRGGVDFDKDEWWAPSGGPSVVETETS